MTFIGHMLMGATVGVVVAPRQGSAWRKVGVLACLAVLGTGPDIIRKLLAGMHQGYAIAHSVFVNAAILLVPLLILGLWRRARRAVGGWCILAGGAAAWISHLVLDATYMQGRGVGVLWPFSTRAMKLTLPWFDTLPAGPDYWQRAIRVWSIELLFWGSLFALVLTARIILVKALASRHAPARP